ncbi:hypothetical protein Tco_1531255 [Tanacetum coccineum]
MKSGDVGVKNSILTSGGEKKRRIHRISEIRKKYSDNKCDGKIMVDPQGNPDQRRVCSLFDNRNPDESSLHKIHTSMSRIGVVEGRIGGCGCCLSNLDGEEGVAKEGKNQFAAEIAAGTLLIYDVAATCVGSTRGATQGRPRFVVAVFLFCCS